VGEGERAGVTGGFPGSYEVGRFMLQVFG
jgi:hypothetical protein